LQGGETTEDCQSRQDDCYVDPAEEAWLRLVEPFGVVSGAASESLTVQLEEAVAEGLSPGVYRAQVEMIFDNGRTATIPVTLTKLTPSGEYTGNLTVYIGGVENSLTGARPLALAMRLKVDQDQTTTWHDLLADHHLAGQSETLIDLSSGFRVRALLHGADSLAFTRSGAMQASQDEIPFAGIYAPEQGRIRLIGVIDVAQDFCISESGACDPDDDDALQVTNPFGRPIRRIIEWVGPFDDTIGRYHGLYREKIQGLVPGDGVTLEGGFILDQVLPDDSDVAESGPLLPASGSNAVAYPDDVEAEVNGAIDQYCTDDLPVDDCDASATAKGHFKESAAFAEYLDQAIRVGSATTCSAQGRTTIFPGLVEFGDAVQQALHAMQPEVGVEGWSSEQQAHLNIYDFLSSRLLPCDDTDPSPPAACIDEQRVRCGLALYQKAILNEWIDMDAVDGTGDNDLHCPDTLGLSGCPQRAVDPANLPSEQTFTKALFTLQEHNRFWWDWGQILKFDGDRARSDAFLVLFRAEANPFLAQSTLAYKADKLREAVRRYDQVMEQIVGPAAASVLFNWPARAFKQWGNDWLGIMQQVTSDRMGAVAEWVDLERRIFMSTGTSDLMFARHLMQHEYLVQVYLMVLQERWQDESFGYLGAAGPILEKGQVVLNQLDASRNALGNVPDRVYFENSNPANTNWENFRDITRGMLDSSRDTVAEAVTQLQSATADLDGLEERLLESKHELEDKLNEICGDPDVLGEGTFEEQSERYCNRLLNNVDFGEWAAIWQCMTSPSDQSDFQCPEGIDLACSTGLEFDDENECDNLVATVDSYLKKMEDVYDDGLGTEDNPEYVDLVGLSSCFLPDSWSARYVEVNGRYRACVGGTMGDLLQERSAIALKARLTLAKLRDVIEDLNALVESWSDLFDIAAGQAGYEAGVALFTWAIDRLIEKYSYTQLASAETANAAKCLVIVGFSNGTDCAGAWVSATVKSTVYTVATFFEYLLKAGKLTVETLAKVENALFDALKTDVERGLQVRTKVREAGASARELLAVAQEAMAVEAKLLDTEYLAQAAADRYAEKVTFVAEHLVGRETGNLLMGDMLVRDASESFRDLVDYTLRTAMAFIHHHSLSEGESASLVNRVLAAVSLDDVQGVLDDLDLRAQQYCGMEAIDCDTGTNVEVLRYSLREQMSPGLRERIDATTGAVLTAGQQFHAAITSPPYLKRRIRGTYPTDQIELVFDLPLTMQDYSASGEPTWMIDPLSCNHLLDAREPWSPTGQGSYGTGTVAANVKMRLPEGTPGASGDKRVRYQLVRGAVDYIRDCHAESVQEEFGTDPILQYPIRGYTVGYAPQSTQAVQGEPASFMTHSAAFTACLNQAELAGDIPGAACWRFFARDRALSGSGWKIVIPLRVDDAATENTWLLGEGLSDEQRPIVEDIVLYFRYRTRPLQED